jgi:hypothetical protein
VPEEWPRVGNGPGWGMVQAKNQDSYSSLLEKNIPYSLSLMFEFLKADALPNLTDVSGRMAQMIYFIS